MQPNSTKTLLGIDIGGTKISVCIGDTSGNITSARRIPIAGINRNYADGLAAITDLCRSVMQSAGVQPDTPAAVGISAPGPLDTRRGLLLAPTNIKGWGNAPIVADLHRHFKLPVIMQNDANACALAELRFGCGRGCDDLVYLTVSTGMGGGIIANGRLVKGISDTAGEVGHFVLDPQGPACACGQRGCFEAFCGGLSVARRLQDLIRREKPSTRILDHAGGDIDRIAFPALLAAVRENDALARRTWDEFVMRMAQGIGIIVMTLNPQMVVLGTIAIHAGELLMQPLREQLRRFAWDMTLRDCRLSVSSLGSSIGDHAALAVAAAAI